MIGVTSAAPANFGAWKRDILFFEKIFVADARSALGVWRNGPFGDQQLNLRLADELEYLLETDFFLSRNESVEQVILTSKDPEVSEIFRSYLDRLNSTFLAYKPALDGFADWEEFAVRLVQPDTRQKIQTHSTLMLQLEAAFQQHQGIDAVLHGVPAWMRVGEASLEPGQAIELVLNNVPVPAETVPWEEIFAIKSDPEIIHRTRKLHLWSNEITKPGMTVKRLNEYIQDSLHDYESYMKANHIRLRSSILKTVVVGTAELWEDIVHLRFGKLAARLFSAEEKRADFILAEARAPGRQLSLVSAVKDRLRSVPADHS
ncbi:MAG: hypothetical protein EOP62_11425 [Sphingomonadales bacterium]|nr:MAG: hypothetical protein EOP62_11425 [Sphingomonadales bacterium]